jgi:hypothetical protein
VRALNEDGSPAKSGPRPGRIRRGVRRRRRIGARPRTRAAPADHHHGSPRPQDGRPVALPPDQDDGRGIDARHLESIFEPFFRAQNERGPAEAGAGLGLAISREIMRSMGGDIRVQSQLGKGSRFTLTLLRA